MEKISVGILTISDRCFRKEVSDESGPNLVRLIKNGAIKNCDVAQTDIVFDDITEIEKILKNWCDEKKLNLILTTGGTGLGPRDVTPEATSAVIEKPVSGIPQLIFKHNSEITPLAALSRCLSGIRGKSLIINFPGSKKAAQECLEAVSSIIPHAVDLICNVNNKNIEMFHSDLQFEYQSKVSSTPSGKKVKYPRKTVPDAQTLILERIYILKNEIYVPLNKSLGNVLAQEIIAPEHFPPFDVSLKDGYAVQSNDFTNERKIIGICNMGTLNSNIEIGTGECAKISTGASLPVGADAVIPVENVPTKIKFDKTTNSEVKVIEIRNHFFEENNILGQEVRAKGSDYKMGSLLLKYGTYLDSAALGLLASAGITSVKIFAKPKVAVFSTGDELVNPMDKLPEGKIRDSNRITILSLLQEESFLAFDLGIVRDEPNALFSSLVKAFKMADVVVTSGGMSMGDKDYMKEIIATDFDSEIFFDSIFMMPGKPTACAILKFQNKTKFWFGFPGNPASAFVTSHLFLLPALKKIAGHQKVLPSSVITTLTFDIPLTDRPQFHRAVLSINKDGNYIATTTGSQRSSRIGSCVNANCLLEIPNGSEILCRGSKVKALLIGKDHIVPNNDSIDYIFQDDN